MRLTALLAALAMMLTTATAQARLFWQTYGSTVAAEPCDGGCAWNINQDYFVPRHCDTGRYDLFSPCKTAHTRSPACKHLHPVYAGYCTPYSACRYRWRDHVYKAYCGCTPLRCEYGPWHLEKCRKHSLVLRDGDCGCGPVGCGSMTGLPDERYALALEPVLDAAALCNVEAFGGVLLGNVAAIPAGTAGSGNTATGLNAAAQMMSQPAATPASSTPAILPKIGVSPPPAGVVMPPPLGF
jgi:hypothetical protein